jgi:hypothetical protein
MKEMLLDIGEWIIEFIIIYFANQQEKHLLIILSSIMHNTEND